MSRDEDTAARLGAWEDLRAFSVAAFVVADLWEAMGRTGRNRPDPEDLDDALGELVQEAARVRRRAGDEERAIEALTDELVAMEPKE